GLGPSPLPPPGPHNLSCVSYKHPSVRGGLGGAGGGRARIVRCPPGHCCIGIWNQSQALVQGCWGGGGASCPSPLCAPSPAGPPGGSVLVCLCRGELCNGNGNGRPGRAGALWLWGAGPLLLLLACLCVLGLRRARARRGRPRQGGSGAPPEPPSPELPALRFLKVGGTHGGALSPPRSLSPRSPAPPQALPRGRFPPLGPGSPRPPPLPPRALGAARVAGGRWGPALLRGGSLGMKLRPKGSLRPSPPHHVGTCAGSVSPARGLASLPRELRRDGLSKPSGVHRDLSIRNALVRDGGTSAIAIGVALCCPGRAGGGSARLQVGTQRYLAPEIPDESLDLRSWGRALLQADVYALALLLWQILSRGQALSPGAPVPAFRLAYGAELGSSPTGPQLRRLPADEGRRPLIPPAWPRTPQVGPGPRPLGRG
ncbi:anti-Muellerian hormone type-2 receptor-like, partial [Pezoporus occidentalis]|uniref:anti-Muellerian hormone type-2 receptor-like n=1 Tax=Pezoporus occidentalis TaxID=407982 RepID=UPI002F9083BF